MLKDSGVLIRLAYRGFQSMGLDADEIIRRAGVSPERVMDNELRTLFSGQPTFWRAAEEVSGDPCIGLHLGEHLPMLRGLVFEYLLLSSANFGEGLERVMNYQRLLSDAISLGLHNGPDGTWLINTFADQDSVSHHLIECLVQGLVKLFSQVTDDRFQPQLIEFRHQARAPESEYQRILNCPVSFGQDEFRIHFEPEVLGYRSLFAQPELLMVHEKVASEQLARLEQNDLLGEVRNHISALLESGDVTLEAVADRCGIQVRQLRHQLTLAGTSFQKELNRYRHWLAKRLLASTNESINEIVYLTGFSEPSTFYRAFKRWQGVTPVAYRQAAHRKN